MANTNDHGGIAAVFFDLGDTLGTATVGGQPPRLIRFDVFPFIPGVLADLQAKGLRLGVISNTGGEKSPAMNAVLQPIGLLARLDPALLVYSAEEGVTKASPEIFNRAATRTGQSADQCLSSERTRPSARWPPPLVGPSARTHCWSGRCSLASCSSSSG
ncbi:MAG: HAD family hydrolase [bacterium]